MLKQPCGQGRQWQGSRRLAAWLLLGAVVLISKAYYHSVTGPILKGVLGEVQGTSRDPLSKTLMLRALSAVRTLDWVVLTGAAVAFVLFALLSWRMIVHERRARLGVPLLVWLAVFAALPYLSPGAPYNFDTRLHLSQTDLVTGALEQGGAIDYTFRWYFGFPVLRYYAPLYHTMAALISVPFGSTILGTKFLIFIFSMTSPLLVYGWLSRLLGDRTAALFGAGAAALANPPYCALMWVGNLPFSPVLLLFPAALWGAEAARSSLRGAFWGGVALGAIGLAHPLFFVQASAVVGVYLLARRISLGRVLLFVFSAAILALPAALPWFTHPPGFAMQGEGNPATWLAPALPMSLDWSTLLRWTPFWSNPPLAYIGLSMLVIAAVGAIVGLRQRDGRTIAILLCVCACMLLISPGFVRGRIVNLVPFLLSALVGVALSGSRRPFWYILAAAALLVDLAPLRFVDAYRPDMDRFEGMRREVVTQPGERVLEIRMAKDGLKTIWWQCSGEARYAQVFGSSTETADLTAKPLYELLRDPEAVMSDPGLAAALGIGKLIVADARGNAVPKVVERLGGDSRQVVFALPGSSPVAMWGNGRWQPVRSAVVESPRMVRLAFALEGPARLRIAYAVHAFSVMSVNGVRMTPSLGALGLPEIELRGGQHVIVIEHPVFLDQMASYLVALGVLVAGVVVMIARRRRCALSAL